MNQFNAGAQWPRHGGTTGGERRNPTTAPRLVLACPCICFCPDPKRTVVLRPGKIKHRPPPPASLWSSSVHPRGAPCRRSTLQGMQRRTRRQRRGPQRGAGAPHCRHPHRRWTGPAGHDSPARAADGCFSPTGEIPAQENAPSNSQAWGGLKAGVSALFPSTPPCSPLPRVRPRHAPASGAERSPSGSRVFIPDPPCLAAWAGEVTEELLCLVSHPLLKTGMIASCSSG